MTDVDAEPGRDQTVGVPLRLSGLVRAGRGQDHPGDGLLAQTREAHRRNKEPPAARGAERIVAAAQALLLRSQRTRVSAKDVCDEARVSRGTLYRYFASMEEVLAAVALRLRDETDRELRRTMEGCDGPDEQFEAFLNYMMYNQEAVRAARLIEVQPLFVLQYLRSNFRHFVARVVDAMASVYDAWDARLGCKVDREAISETMVRYVLSELVAPTPASAVPLPIRLRPFISAVLHEGVAERQP